MSCVKDSDACGKNSQSKKVDFNAEQLQLFVMQLIDQVDAKKDELTTKLNRLSDLETQLRQICAQQDRLIRKSKDGV